MPLLAVLLLCLVAPGYGQRRGLQSDGVVVYYNARDEAFAVTASQAATAALPRLRSALQIDPTTADRRPISLSVVRTMKEFEQLAGRQVDPWVQGMALPERRIIVQTLAPPTMKVVVAHELAHVLLDELAEPLHVEPPRWLHEGLAKYSTDDFSMADRQVLGEAVVQRRLLGLHDLNKAFSGSREQVSLAYAESYTLVRYLHELQPGGLARFLHELALTSDTDRALLRTYGQPVDKLEAAWLEQVKQDYLKHGLDLLAQPLIFGIMALLFIVVYLVQRRRRRLIREALQEEERLQRMFGYVGEEDEEGGEGYEEEDLGGDGGEDVEDGEDGPRWPEFR